MAKNECPFRDCLIEETENFKVFQDWEVPIPGFLVIGSKKDVDSILDFSEQEYSEFCNLILKWRKVLKDKLKIEKVYFFQSEDSDTGFHYLLFPRYSWMDKFGKKLKSFNLIKKYAEENMLTAEKIEEVKDVAEKLKKI
ncbi:HIT family hydrolase [Candidatus Pacearchaeota archaeon]|nr:HIT family hydrolase [Candidatus Pacearchaeota archaeon]